MSRAASPTSPAGSDPERPLAGQPWLVAPATRAVLDALEGGGRPVRLVGGCVRDALAGRLVDGALDLATPEPPERVMELLESAGIKTVPTGIEHGTVTAVVDGRPFEITTLRRDVACDGRHAEVAFTDDFDADAARRDFTINAMSCDREGRLHDPFGGREDLEAGRVRFVGDPRARIAEDYLRILRFFRFRAHYGRGDPDPEALAACAEAAALIDRLSGERLHAELFKLLEAADPVPSLRHMRAAGVLAHIIGEPVNAERLARLVALDPETDALLRLAALLRPPPGAPDQAERAAERLRLSRREQERLLALATLPLPEADASPAGHRRALYRHGAERYRDLLRLARAEQPEGGARHADALALASTWQPPPFPITGADLLARGVPEGPKLGSLLAELESWWLEQDFAPDRAACLAELERRIAPAPSPGRA